MATAYKVRITPTLAFFATLKVYRITDGTYKRLCSRRIRGRHVTNRAASIGRQIVRDDQVTRRKARS